MHKFSDYSSKLSPHIEFDPKAFIEGANANSNLCNFILTLALAFNDFRFYNTIFQMLEKSKPQGTVKRNAEWGEYSGIKLYIIRLHIGFVHELFNLIKENKLILEDPFLKEIIRCLNSKARKSWAELIEAALTNDASPRRSNPLYMIRNKLVFHYDPKELFEGYKKGFFKEGTKTENACISRGDSLSEARFYFADKAVEGYIAKKLEINIESFFSSFGKTMQDINIALYSICELFIQKQGCGWKSPSKI